jgi:hypothetical protein
MNPNPWPTPMRSMILYTKSHSLLPDSRLSISIRNGRIILIAPFILCVPCCVKQFPNQVTALVEGTVFVLPNFPFPPTVANYSTFLEKNFGTFAQQINQTYPLSKFSSLPYPIYSAMVVIVTDFAYVCRAYQAMTTASQKDIPSYAYVWGQEPTCPWYSAIGDN